MRISTNFIYETVRRTMQDSISNLLQVEEMDRLTKMDLDITEYKAGLYMIQIHSDQLHSVARLIKE